jgi:hypothetical protein
VFSHVFKIHLASDVVFGVHFAEVLGILRHFGNGVVRLRGALCGIGADLELGI